MSKRLACVLALLGLSAVYVLAPSAASAVDGANAGMARLQRAIQAAEREAFPFSISAAFSAAIKGYLGAIDVYSTYVSPEEAQFLRAADSHEFVGVGMDIIKDYKGFLYCLPYAGSPAEQAGIGYGDMLRTIDGVQAEALSLQGVQSRIRGKEGSRVALGIVSAEGLREYVLTRRHIVAPSVELLRDDVIPRIRIIRFDKHTMGELRVALLSIVAGSPLILDLRGNIGGDLHVAVECAGLFLPEASLVATVQNKNAASTVLRTKAEARRPMAGPIVLWQDSFTASAAEVFCAALSQNKRGRTLGQRSFGKGLTQRVSPAGDGGLFIITNAELLTPDGKTFHRIGLEPDLPVMQRSASAHQDFLRRSHEAFSLKP